MSLAAAAGAGAALGLRHALETDHLAAVATLVEPEDSRSQALVGASWGVGHSVPILVSSLLFLGLGVRVPPGVVHVVEGLVGVVLIALGLRLLAVTVGGFDLAAHSHDTSSSDRDRHRHLRLGPIQLGRHGHIEADSAIVGVVHGVAGSGALVVAVASTASTLPVALSFLAGFAVLSILTMAAVSLLWGHTLGTGVARPLQAAAGGAGIVVGVVLIAEVVLGGGVL